MHCDVGFKLCPGGTEINGCIAPDICVPSTIGQCVNHCPCPKDKYTCPGGDVDANGCRLPPICVPLDDPSDCPSEKVIVVLGGYVVQGGVGSYDPSTKATIFNDTQCEILNMTRGSYRGTGALLDKRPMYCGGRDSDGVKHGDCFHLRKIVGNCMTYERWVKLGSLHFARTLPAAVAVNNQMVWVTGGVIDDVAGGVQYTNSTEIVFANGTIVWGPNLPNGVRGHCMVKTDNGLIYSTGGFFNGGIVTNIVWVFNEALELLNTGSELKMQLKRQWHGCGVVHSNNYGGRQVVIVAGGFGISDPSITAEILDFTTPGSSWTLCMNLTSFYIKSFVPLLTFFSVPSWFPSIPIGLTYSPGVFQLPGHNKAVMFSKSGVIVLSMENGQYTYVSSANPDLYPRGDFTSMMVPKDSLKCFDNPALNEKCS